MYAFTPPAPQLSDGCVKYQFTAHPITAPVYGLDVVYSFAHWDGLSWRLHYIGKADILSDRLSGHERKLEAIIRGATHVLVHQPGDRALVNYLAAEQRLIRFYNPPMNVVYRTA